MCTCLFVCYFAHSHIMCECSLYILLTTCHIILRAGRQAVGSVGGWVGRGPGGERPSGLDVWGQESQYINFTEKEKEIQRKSLQQLCEHSNYDIQKQEQNSM